jgi:hypothetical protein
MFFIIQKIMQDKKNKSLWLLFFCLFLEKIFRKIIKVSYLVNEKVSETLKTKVQKLVKKLVFCLSKFLPSSHLTKIRVKTPNKTFTGNFSTKNACYFMLNNSTLLFLGVKLYFLNSFSVEFIFYAIFLCKTLNIW